MYHQGQGISLDLVALEAQDLKEYPDLWLLFRDKNSSNSSSGVGCPFKSYFLLLLSCRATPIVIRVLDSFLPSLEWNCTEVLIQVNILPLTFYLSQISRYLSPIGMNSLSFCSIIYCLIFGTEECRIFSPDFRQPLGVYLLYYPFFILLKLASTLCLTSSRTISSQFLAARAGLQEFLLVINQFLLEV